MMIHRSAVMIASLLLVFPASSQAQDAKPPKLDVTIDTTASPGSGEWAAKAKTLTEEWYPKIAAILASDGYTPPDHVRLVFKDGMKGVAGTTGTTVTISGDWIKQHPDDFGMVIHEVTHVIQRYPSYRAGWLVEGIADHVRFVTFEPGVRQPPINPEKASYRDGYRTTFRFLDWVQRTYAPKLITQLNAALRQGRYKPELFQELAGKPLDDLWKEFVATLPKPEKKPTPKK